MGSNEFHCNYVGPLATEKLEGQFIQSDIFIPNDLGLSFEFHEQFKSLLFITAIEEIMTIFILNLDFTSSALMLINVSKASIIENDVREYYSITSFIQYSNH